MIKKYSKGFTLLELLVSLSIIALLLAVVQVQFAPTDARKASLEADKLVAKLNAAQAHMAAGFTPLKLVVKTGGYGFEQLENPTFDQNKALDTDETQVLQAKWRTIETDEVFKPHQFANDKMQLLLPTDGLLSGGMVLSKEPISQGGANTTGRRIQLIHARGILTIAIAGAGVWRVEAAK